jgi:hypothetical protein
MLLSLLLLACSGQTKVSGKDLLTECFTNFDAASEFGQARQGLAVGKVDPPKAASHLSHIWAGLAASGQISDSYLDSLHPGMKTAFRDHYEAGHRIYLQGLVEGDVIKQLSGSALIAKWRTGFWSQNGSAIADRAFGAE